MDEAGSQLAGVRVDLKISPLVDVPQKVGHRDGRLRAEQSDVEIAEVGREAHRIAYIGIGKEGRQLDRVSRRAGVFGNVRELAVFVRRNVLGKERECGGCESRGKQKRKAIHRTMFLLQFAKSASGFWLRLLVDLKICSVLHFTRSGVPFLDPHLFQEPAAVDLLPGYN